MQDKVALHLSPRLGAPSSLGRPCLHVLTCGQGSATPSASVLCPRMAGLTSSACSTPCWLPLRGHKGPSWVLRLWGRWGTACARVSGSHPCPGSWQSPLVLAGVGFSRPGAPLKWGDPIPQIPACPQEPHDFRRLLYAEKHHLAPASG